MDSHLTEIKNSHLFTEYLMCSGIKLPRSRSENWEFFLTPVKIVSRPGSREMKKGMPVFSSVQPCLGVNERFFERY